MDESETNNDICRARVILACVNLIRRVDVRNYLCSKSIENAVGIPSEIPEVATVHLLDPSSEFCILNELFLSL